MSGRRGLVAVALAVATIVGALTGASSRGEEYELPDTITLFAAVPGGEEVNYLIADDAFHEAELAMAWVEQQTGRTFRRGPGYAQVIQLTLPEENYVGSPEVAAALIVRDVLDRAGLDSTFPLILADLRTEPDGAERLTCGIGGQVGVVVFIQNCPHQRLSRQSVWGSNASLTIAHELLHGLGAASVCGTSADGTGHVYDDPTDILQPEVLHGVPPHLITLDAGRDDYFQHGIPDCHDIADSPLWE